MAEEKGQGLRSCALNTLRLYENLLSYLDRLAVGCLYKQPTRVVREDGCLFFQPAQAVSSCAGSGLGKVYESTGNCSLLFPFTVTLRRSHDACINQRIDSLPCPALFSMFPGRLARFARGRTPEFHGRGLSKLQRSACAGSNYVWIMRGGWRVARGQCGKWLSTCGMELRAAV